MNLPISILLKAFLEGLTVAIAAFLIPGKKTDISSIIVIGFTATVVFMLLDIFSPDTGLYARQGAGFGIGLNQIGFGNGLDNFSKTDNIEIGTDLTGNTVKFDTRCNQYYTDNDEIKNEVIPPLDNTKVDEPHPLRTLPPNYSYTNVNSSRMNFVEDNIPVNSNTNEYKIVNGMYSKYALQPGYNANLSVYNTHDNLHDVSHTGTSILDRYLFEPVINSNE